VNGLSLCSGIGAGCLGLKHTIPGYRTVCYVENAKFPQDVLLARMADGVLDRAPIWGDLKRFDARPWRGLVDLVHGGYPCQPFSVAGKRLGTDDPRHLWPDIARIVRECEPEWCVFENVAGHLRLGFNVVARDLVEMGYRVAAGLFTASEIGAPHRRERLFIVAHSDRELHHGSGHAGTRGRRELADGVCKLGDANDARLEGRRESVGERTDEWPAWPPGPEERDRWASVLAVRPDLAPATVADATNRRARGAGSRCDTRGTAEGDATEPVVRRVVDGAANRVDRLKALGNTVVPAVVVRAVRTLMAELA
jgi:DNA (cytosine-5)-methyltransferase 1